jgi:hypothetical protein
VGWGLGGDLREDTRQDCGEAGQHFLIAEPKDLVVIGFQMRGAGGIFFWKLVVNAAVYFEDEFVSGAVEVQNKLADGMLESKVESGEAVAAQRCPKGGFGGCGVGAVFAGQLVQFRGGAAHIAGARSRLVSEVVSGLAAVHGVSPEVRMAPRPHPTKTLILGGPSGGKLCQHSLLFLGQQQAAEQEAADAQRYGGGGFWDGGGAEGGGGTEGDAVPVFRLRGVPANGVEGAVEAKGAVAFLAFEDIRLRLGQGSRAPVAGALAEKVEGSAEVIVHDVAGSAEAVDGQDRVDHGRRKGKGVGFGAFSAGQRDDVTVRGRIGNGGAGIRGRRRPVVDADAVGLGEEDIAGVGNGDRGLPRLGECAGGRAGGEAGRGGVPGSPGDLRRRGGQRGERGGGQEGGDGKLDDGVHN